MPIGAVGGRADIMRKLAPLGPVYQAGTLSGNPVAVAAGLAMLQLSVSENPYPKLDVLGRRLTDGLNAAARKAGLALHCTGLGGMFTPFFMADAPTDLATAKHCDTKAYAAFFRAMLARGFYLPPSQFEAAFISAAHSNDDVDRFLTAAGEVFATLS
jgi:glutamate-1-semialdehyde 2,1-aminomutase